MHPKSFNNNKVTMKYKYALFDLDGTLVDNYTAIYLCAKRTFEEFGLPPADYDTVFNTVGGSIFITLKKLASCDDVFASKLGERYLQLYPEFIFEGLKALPYAVEILTALQKCGVKTACFTNKQESGARPILEYLKLDSYLDAIVGTDLHSPRKPDAEYTKFALNKLSADKNFSILIGDSPYDYLAAQNGSIDSALVTTGADSLEKLKEKCPNAIGYFSNLAELADKVFDLKL